MKLILLLFGIIAAANAVSFIELAKEEWHAYKDIVTRLNIQLEHRKDYKSETEENFRMKIYLENKIKVAKHNQRFEKGLVSFKLGLNKYSDMLHHEFINTMNGYNKTKPGLTQASGGKKEEGAYFISPANVQLPKQVDWRQKGAVTPVKDQGHCGSCWAFSTTGSLEGQHSRRSGVLVSLSEQNLVDCSTAYGNNGCNGGLMDNAFRYIKDNGGIDTEKAYPYEATDDTCHFQPANVGATDKGFVDIPQGDEKKLMEAIATIGPASVAIDASRESFQFYTSGVYYDEQCSSDQLDHGVLVVGYGTDPSGQDFWLVKNSWGTTWGDEGYIKMARNKDNHCGIATSASYPLV